MPNRTILDYYEIGLADGFYLGEESEGVGDLTDEQRVAYKRGYDRGVAMYCDTIDDDSHDYRDGIEEFNHES